MSNQRQSSTITAASGWQHADNVTPLSLLQSQILSLLPAKSQIPGLFPAKLQILSLLPAMLQILNVLLMKWNCQMMQLSLKNTGDLLRILERLSNKRGWRHAADVMRLGDGLT